MKDRITWGIIGAGKIAEAFSRGVNKSKTGQLLAVASREQARADKFATDFNIPRSYGSYDALIADKEIQAVYVCTPHPMHAEWALKAITAGKHVLCEKPMCVNYWDAMAIVEAARLKGVALMEAFMYRCHPQTARIVELVKSKVVGEVRAIQGTFGYKGTFNKASRTFDEALAGGGIVDVGCYPVSMARLIAGAAQGKDFADPIEVKATGILQDNVDTCAVATLKFPGDILAFCQTAVTVAMENIVKITGTEGTITIPNPWLHDRINPPISKIIVQKAGQKDPEEINVTTDGTSFQIEADVFGGLVQSGTQEASSPAMSWADTLGNMQTLDRWRAEVGLTYSIEKLDNFRKTTVSGKALAVDPKNNMKYGQIPHLDRKVSRLIYGCDNQHTLAHMVVMADDAFEKGINTFDTAWLYGGGRMETLLGQWMKLRGVRKDMNIIMKGGHTPYCYPANITNMITQSLERMQIDSAEIYIMHRDNLDVPVGEFVDVLNEHKKAGRIKCFGGSNWTIARLAEANEYARKKGLQPLSLLNNNFSLARMVNPVWPGCVAASDPESRAFLTKNQIANLSWSSQARGFFVPGIAAPEKTSNKELVNSWYAEDNFQRQARAIELAKKYKVEPITIALAYVLCQPFPSFALIGPRSLSETRTSLPALDIQLSEAELKWLNLELDRA